MDNNFKMDLSDYKTIELALSTQIQDTQIHLVMLRQSLDWIISNIKQLGGKTIEEEKAEIRPDTDCS